MFELIFSRLLLSFKCTIENVCDFYDVHENNVLNFLVLPSVMHD